RLASVHLRLEPGGHGDEKGGRGAETRARRDFGSHPHALRLNAKLLPYRPQVRNATLDATLHRPFRRWAAGDLGVPIDRGRQHHATEVIHVLSDQVDSTRGTPVP